MNRPSKQDFYTGENQNMDYHYDKIGYIKALNKYVDDLETKIKFLEGQALHQCGNILTSKEIFFNYCLGCDHIIDQNN